MVCRGAGLQGAAAGLIAPKLDSRAPAEQPCLARGFARMAYGSEKLRALARQSRAMSMLARDPHRARSLLSLASLYERQAVEAEARELRLVEV